MTRRQWLYVLLALCTIASFPILFGSRTGLLVQIIIVGSMLNATWLWTRTNLRRPTDPMRLLPAYLAMGAALMVHIVEEVAAGFGPAIGELVGSPFDDRAFIESFVFYLPILWIAGAIAIARRHPMGGFLAWFLCVGMIFGEWTHVGLFPVLSDGRYSYFPGMWTALLPMIPALWAASVMWSDSKQTQHA